MNVNENNIRPYLLDIPEGDHDVRITVQETEYAAAARHHDLADTAAAGVEFQIAHPSQLSAVLDINDILVFQLRIKHLLAHKPFLFTICAPAEGENKNWA